MRWEREGITFRQFYLPLAGLAITLGLNDVQPDIERFRAVHQAHEFGAARKVKRKAEIQGGSRRVVLRAFFLDPQEREV